MKLAAAEGLMDGGRGAAFTIVPGVKIPKMLSILATHKADGFVPGINDILNGYIGDDGVRVPSVAEKMEAGRNALDALAVYRSLKDVDPGLAASSRQMLEENVQYMGYGHLSSPEEVITPVGVVFWAFRLMIGLGMLIALVLLLALVGLWKKKLTSWKWLLRAAVLCIPLVYITGQCGWIVAEVGRQPWTIQGLLPVNVAISSLSAGHVMTTFFIFLAVFALFLTIEIRILLRAIGKGPDVVEPSEA